MSDTEQMADCCINKLHTVHQILQWEDSNEFLFECKECDRIYCVFAERFSPVEDGW